MLSKKELDEIRAREQEATPGPWITFCDHKQHFDDEFYIDGFQCEGDIVFVANARTDIPALLFHIEEQDKRIAKLQADYDRINDFEQTQSRKLLGRVAELERERDAAMADIRQACGTCIDDKEPTRCPWPKRVVASTGEKVGVCNAWRWRGVMEDC